MPTITGGHARTRQCKDRYTWNVRRPGCTLSHLPSSREYDRRVTQSPATREPPFRWSPPYIEGISSRRPWTCHRTRGPTVLSRMSCRPISRILTVFTSLACYPGRTPLTATDHGWLLGRDRWDCRPHATWRPPALAGSPVSRSCVSVFNWRLLHHADWTAPRQGRLDSPFSSACAAPWSTVFAHTQVRDPRGFAAAACEWHALGAPSPWPPLLFVSRAEECPVSSRESLRFRNLKYTFLNLPLFVQSMSLRTLT